MVKRPFWERRIRSAFRRRSVVWLMGVRRAGKTVLAGSLPGFEYLDCELPRVRRLMDDPEGFLAGLRGRRAIVLDEVHRLQDPAAVLKIAADHFPNVRVLATGSSTLGASARFRDTLAGRKAEVWLTPMCHADLLAFGNSDLGHRCLHGGLPGFFLAKRVPEADFQEWMDAFWAKDVLELFRLERRASFHRFAELVFAGSGGIFEATKFARPCEVSRQTIMNYLSVLEATFVVHVVRPFSGGTSAEIVAAPRVYAFDTGFVCQHRGWRDLRREDLGALFEHLVLNELHAFLGSRGSIRYWRSKAGPEVDFVLDRPGRPVAIECKWSAGSFEPGGIQSFRRRHPGPVNLVVAADVDRPFERRYGSMRVRFVGLGDLAGPLARGRSVT
ncbi:MAG: ATP-binding protein [Acidobacteria bacterium]|nr:ATP-binding protein [Acidobacteriota bacterium]